MRRDKPSHTAYKVAITIVALGAEPRMRDRLPQKMVEATTQLLIHSGAAQPWFIRACRAGRARGLIRFFEKLFGPIYSATYYGLGERKLFYERQVREAINEGAAQVLVLGAGYDTLAWRLSAEYPQVKFVEIDHPATGKLKRQAIEKMGTRENLVLLPVDLGHARLPDVLAGSLHWDNDTPSIFLAEGLLMYLPQEAVQTLLRYCSRCSPKGSRLAFDHFFQRADGRPDLGRLTWIFEFTLKLAGEPILWSIAKESLPQFLQDNGWENSPELVGSPDHITIEGFAVARR